MGIRSKVEVKTGDKPATKAKAKDDDPMSSALRNDELDDEDDDDDDDDDSGEELDEGGGGIKKPIIIAGIVVVVILVAVLIFMVTRPKPQPEPPPPEPTPVAEVKVDQTALDKQALYEHGIGKEYVDEANIFEQGNLESPRFRKDFQGEDQPEMFVTPVKINTVKDSISYIKHRAFMGNGIETYWLEGMYKGVPCHLTIPYSVYQNIAPAGTIDVTVEVVTDKNGSITITSFTAIPPSTGSKK